MMIQDVPSVQRMQEVVDGLLVQAAKDELEADRMDRIGDQTAAFFFRDRAEECMARALKAIE